ncbi:MAG: ABC transporter permease, partial [Muribaculaceae bacterium]|nr:ABC transporter permease [Muribaculaceae bacterium]
LVPSLVMFMTGPENKTIAVLDSSGFVASTLKGDNELKFVTITDPAITVDSVRSMSEYDAILFIGEDVADNTDNVQLYTQSAPSMQTEAFIRGQIESAIEHQRMKKYEIDNLSAILADLEVDVKMSTYRLDKEETEETSSIVSYLIGMFVSLMLYMFLVIYGQMVMNSIIEEKNNRVLEIIVSSVRPQTLMLGKILGVGLVAVTQILIWGILIGSFSKWIMPIISSGISTDDVDLMTALGQFSNPTYVMTLFLYILLFLIGGYLFYSSIFAAIGSAVDNVQDASQLTTVALVPIIIGMVFSMTVANDPNSSLAFWLSIIPFTSPMVMMARIPFGIPVWEIILSLVLLAISLFVMIWIAAKIYRVGIFMYGKKPSFADLIKWVRYK